MILFELTKKDIAKFEKALKHVKVTESNCHIWQGVTGTARLKDSQYGGFKRCDVFATSERANRVAYAYHHGPFDQALIVRHTCDVRGCINPEHLILGTYLDNAIDREQRNPTAREGRVLNEECVKVIKWMLKYKYDRKLTAKLAKLHKCSWHTINEIKHGKTWCHVIV